MLWRLALVLPRRLLPDAETRLEGLTLAVTAMNAEGLDTREDAPDDPWRLTCFVNAQTLAQARAVLEGIAGTLTPRPQIAAEAVIETDWAAASAASFAPQRIGRFVVHGAHVTAPPHGVRLKIDAGSAFGTGEHATTRLCLKGLEALSKRMRARRILDLGTGSGILAIAAAHLWPASIIGSDNDPRATRAAERARRANRLAGCLRFLTAEGLEARAIERARPYDLVVANILLRPLLRLAPGMARALAPGGYLLLSGVLAQQQAALIAACRAQGLALETRLAEGEWRALILRKRACAGAGPRAAPEQYPNGGNRTVPSVRMKLL